MDTMIELPAQLRSAELAPNSVDPASRTVEVIWSAGARVRRASLFGESYDEELSLDPAHVPLGVVMVVNIDQRQAGSSTIDNQVNVRIHPHLPEVRIFSGIQLVERQTRRGRVCWRSKAVILTAFCSYAVRRERLSEKVSAMRNSITCRPGHLSLA